MIPRRSAGLTLSIVVFLTAATGCSFTRPSLERQSFALSADRSASERPAQSAPTRSPATLKVGRISMQPPYGGTSFVYRTSELRYEIDPYNGFFSSPGDLLGFQIAQWLNRSGRFASVREPASPLTGDYVLEGLVTELYGDIRDRQAPSAVVSLTLYMRRAGADGAPVFERAYTQRVAMGNASAGALARAYGAALSRILGALEHDLAAVKLEK